MDLVGLPYSMPYFQAKSVDYCEIEEDYWGRWRLENWV